MNDVDVFTTGIAITAAASLAVIVYLRRHLKLILIDLCGTEERADFWAVLSNINLILVPLIFALGYRSEHGKGVSLFFPLAEQLQQGFIGLVTTVFVVGVILSLFIPKTPPGVRPPEDARRVA